MNLIITIIQLLVSFALSTAILLQSKGTGLGSTFGGGSNFVHVRRGAEKVMFQVTIVLSVAFVVLSLANLLVG